VKEFLPKLLLMDIEGLKEDPCKTLRSAFLGTQRMLIELTRTGKLDASSSGTTSSVILHNHKDGVLYVAHVGDSRCVIASSRPDKQGVVATDLMQDHKPDLPLEKARIEKNGGEVRKNPYDVTSRVYVSKERYPGLAMSRALGDLIGYNYAGVAAEPETSMRVINRAGADSGTSQSNGAQLNGVVPTPLNVPEGEPGASAAKANECDQFILLCSDGVWEFMSSQEAVAIAARLPPRKAMQAAEEIARISWDRWIQEEGGRVVDDITAVLIYISDPTSIVNVLAK
jgi:serine/threonine protein phosphatase PrpC